MAEINISAKGGRRKVAAPRIDLTPMVDLGFLLITFFMYTTTMVKAKTMQLNMPDNGKTNQPMAFAEESTITIIPGRDHQYFYYNGVPDDARPISKTNQAGLRDVILEKTKQVRNLGMNFSADAHKLHVLIKPGGDCTYGDVVAVLDEMQINAVDYFVLTDLTDYEKEWVYK